MLKRRPGTELNHDNWNEEEEPEEKGEFRMASENELKNRVIKTARRRNPNDKPPGSAAASVFGSFSGFTSASGGASSASSNTNTPSIFAFLSQDKPKTDTPDGSNDDNKDTEYHQKLKALNQSVCDWIKRHVDQTPVCILTPIFRDYEKYLKEIESSKTGSTAVSLNGKKEETKSEEAMKSNFDIKPTATASATAFKGFSFGSAAAASTPVAAPPPTSTSIFGVAKSSDSTLSNFSSAPKISFGSSSGSSSIFSTTTTAVTKSPESTPLVPSASTGFSFGGAKPFSFGVTGPPPAAASASSDTKNGEAEEENDEDEPPKVEFKQVVEEDNVYSKRCKVFFKIDGNFQERGLGTLFVKPVKDSAKHQLIVRADTSLGNILVNLVLAKGLPVKKMGANNVMLVCIPNRDFEKPVSVLLKVKTADDADELAEKLESYSAE